MEHYIDARLADPAAADPQRSFRSPPRTASWPHPTEGRGPGTPSPIIPTSTRPTSRPIIYPAEKLIAENRTTTPALMTHVMIVGLTVVAGSVMLTRRLFFEAVPRSLGELERRFALAAAGSDDTAGALTCLCGAPIDGPDSGYRGEGEVSSSLLSSPIATEAPTSRNEAGWSPPEGAAGVGDGRLSFFGRPLAAAAHERSVDRLARRAASWSA
jgi:hypothetical protein